jgi:hypothetical protein
MLSLEYRNMDKQKAKDFIDKLKNKLDLEIKNNSHLNSIPLQGKEVTKNKIEIISVPNPAKRHNQFYYKLILK